MSGVHVLVSIPPLKKKNHILLKSFVLLGNVFDSFGRNPTQDKFIEMSNSIEKKKQKTLFQVCCYSNSIMCAYAISIWGKIVGGECMVWVNAPICRSERLPACYWWFARLLNIGGSLLWLMSASEHAQWVTDDVWKLMECGAAGGEGRASRAGLRSVEFWTFVPAAEISLPPSPVSSPHLPPLCGVTSPDQHKAWAPGQKHGLQVPEPPTHHPHHQTHQYLISSTVLYTVAHTHHSSKPHGAAVQIHQSLTVNILKLGQNLTNDDFLPSRNQNAEFFVLSHYFNNRWRPCCHNNEGGA